MPPIDRGHFWLKKPIFNKKSPFLAKIHKKTPILPKIAKHGLETNSRFN